MQSQAARHGRQKLVAEAGHAGRILAHGVMKARQIRSGDATLDKKAAQLEQQVDQTANDAMTHEQKSAASAGRPVDLRCNMITPRSADIEQCQINCRKLRAHSYVLRLKQP